MKGFHLRNGSREMLWSWLKSQNVKKNHKDFCGLSLQFPLIREDSLFTTTPISFCSIRRIKIDTKKEKTKKNLEIHSKIHQYAYVPHLQPVKLITNVPVFSSFLIIPNYSINPSPCFFHCKSFRPLLELGKEIETRWMRRWSDGCGRPIFLSLKAD